MRAGEFTMQVAARPITLGGLLTMPFADFPMVGPTGRLSYLRKIRLYAQAAIDTGASGASAFQIHNLLASVTCKTFGRNPVHGPFGLTGADLSALWGIQTGRRLGQPTLLGDRAIAASQSAVASRPFWEIDYTQIGEKPADFSKAVRSMASGGGYLQIQFAAADAAVIAAATGTLYVEAVCDERDEYCAVPNVIMQRQGVETLVGGNLGFGTARILALLNAGNWAEGDITSMDLRVNGQPFVGRALPDFYQIFRPRLTLAGAAGAEVPAYLDNFIAPIGSTSGLPRYLVAWPSDPRERRATKMPRGQLVYYIQGAETAGNLTWVTEITTPLQYPDLIEQFTSQGLTQDRVAAAIRDGQLGHKTAGGGKMPGEDYGETAMRLAA